MNQDGNKDTKNHDIDLICRITKCNKEQAKKALEDAQGDVARAVLILISG